MEKLLRIFMKTNGKAKLLVKQGTPTIPFPFKIIGHHILRLMVIMFCLNHKLCHQALFGFGLMNGT
jgi:hypothetical protein